MRLRLSSGIAFGLLLATLLFLPYGELVRQALACSELYYLSELRTSRLEVSLDADARVSDGVGNIGKGIEYYYRDAGEYDSGLQNGIITL